MKTTTTTGARTETEIAYDRTIDQIRDLLEEFGFTIGTSCDRDPGTPEINARAVADARTICLRLRFALQAARSHARRFPFSK